MLVVDVSFIYDLGNGKVILMSCKTRGPRGYQEL